MKILVTGTKGQVSQCLQERAALDEDVDLVAVGRPELDLLKPEAIGAVIVSHKPDIVVSAAAYTAVDQAEDEPEIAFAVNEIGAGAVAAAARDVGAPVIHLSTDYVFSGELGRPYTEQDEPNPINVYGASKLAGERAVAIANKWHIILRTSWVYSPFGRNFVKTMHGLACSKNVISVVDDQFGTPTSANDLAEKILTLSSNICGNIDPALNGIFHLAGDELMSWADFAERIFQERKLRGEPYAVVKRIKSAEYQTKAKRPKYSGLGTVRPCLKRLNSIPALKVMKRG